MCFHSGGPVGGYVEGWSHDKELPDPLAAEHIRQLSAPVGIIMTDFAGVDASKGIRVSGREPVLAVIENNF